MINTKSIEEARKQIQKLKKQKKKVIVSAQDSEFNRKIVEMPDVDVLLSPEIHERTDKLKQRDSGLNEILCRLAAKNNVKIGVDINKIKKLTDKEKAKALSRISQNIMLCRKTKCSLILVGSYDKKDAFSFLLTLGASTSQAKKAVSL
jgi:ribonuclease P/MRP protein subunit RPP1